MHHFAKRLVQARTQRKLRTFIVLQKMLKVEHSSGSLISQDWMRNAVAKKWMTFCVKKFVDERIIWRDKVKQMKLSLKEQALFII